MPSLTLPEEVKHEALMILLVAGVVGAVVIAALLWLNFSNSRISRRWRGEVKRPNFPHMHGIDGVMITHSHARGNRSHTHDTITVSASHYADLTRRANANDSQRLGQE